MLYKDNMGRMIFIFIKKTTKRLSQPDVFFYCGLWLLVLLVCGTVEQKYIGLYQAQSKYFSAFFFKMGFLPLPASRTVLSVILVNLLIKTAFYTKNIQKHIGSFVTHTGIVLLIMGGFITALFSREGYIAIPEGEQTHIISDYHNVELAITDLKTGDGIAFPQKFLENQKSFIRFSHKSGAYEGKTLCELSPEICKKSGFIKDNIPLRIKEFIRNTEPVKREVPATGSFVPYIKIQGMQESEKIKPHQYKGFARIFKLKRKKLEKVNENNIAGLIFQISGNETEELYSIFEGMPIKQTVKWKGRTYTVELRPERTYLPFAIHLIDFKKEYYPGTDKPQSYQSLVEIRSPLSKQKRMIKMNQPLRLRGYTFYQSSFMEGEEEGETTVLAAVRNAGRAFPYIASLIISFGLLIHIVLNISFLRKRIQRTSL